MKIKDQPVLKRHKIDDVKRIILTRKEKGELFMEGCLTAVLLLMLDVAVLVILQQFVHHNPSLENMIYGIKTVVWFTYNFSFAYSWRGILLFILGIIDIIVLCWRLRRRYKQFQLQHIISELHYIANGHYNHLVHFELSGDLGSIVNSINGLVTSTREAIEEERRIKQSKEELITNVSHDIRTPLTSIIGYLQLIETQNPLNDEEVKQYVHIAYSKAQQMKSMVDDVFEYSTMTSQNNQLHLTKFDLNQLVEQFEVDFALQVKDVKLSINITPQPFYLEADADKIVRIFSNLISNALKYGKDATEIQIIARKVENHAKIVVRNNGASIPKEALGKLFDRFYRMDSSRNQAIKGTGLGLAIVESIVTLHHGHIHAESNQSWTSFIIDLPLAQSQEN